MRAVFGLVGLLITVGVIVLVMKYAFLPHTEQVATSGREAREEARQIAGVSQTGGRVADSVKFEPFEEGSRLTGLRVAAVIPGTSYQSFYGLELGDIIDQIGPQFVRDIGDTGLAESLAYEAYQRQWELGVRRNMRRYMLPSQRELAAGNSADMQRKPLQQQSADPTPLPAEPPRDTRSPLQRQLDTIQQHGQ